MDERELDYLKRQIHELERANRRWKVITVALSVAFGLLLLLGAFSSLFVATLQTQRARNQAMMLEVERARAAQLEAREQAEQAAERLRQAEQQDKRMPKN